VDPFVLLRLPIAAWRFWRRLLGLRWLLVLTGLSTLLVLVLGCRETYG